MCDEVKESTPKSQKSEDNAGYKPPELQSTPDIQQLDLKKPATDTPGLKHPEETETNTPTEFGIKNCYDSLPIGSIFTTSSPRAGEPEFLDVFFSFVKKGFGIAQIVGSNGSGKTSICLKIAHTVQGTVLYLDTCGSFDPSRAPRTTQFIPLRLYTPEELVLFLTDLETRLSNDDVLCERIPVKARSVEMLIVDSLWCVEQLDKYHRNEFLFATSVLLRKIAWKYNIYALACVNYREKQEKPPRRAESTDGTKKGSPRNCVFSLPNLYKKWNSNCYVQFLLKYKIFTFKPGNSDKYDQVRPVYRIMHINSGSVTKKYRLTIDHDNISLHNI